MSVELKDLLGVMRAEVDGIPRGMRQEEVIRQGLVCLLASAVRQMGLVPLLSWKPPLSTRERIDLVGVKPDSDPPQVELAVVVEALVEHHKVKALEWVECPQKVVVTFSERKDKVEQSTFFLTPGLRHLHLYE